MSEEKQSFWERLFGMHRRSEREEKVLEYVCYRVGDGAHLEDVIQEEYVRRNATPDEIDEIRHNPRLVHASHEQMREYFNSEELKPKAPPSSAE